MFCLSRCALLAGLGILLAAAAPPARSTSTPTTFSGQATVVSGSLSLLPPVAQSLASTALPCKPPDATRFCVVDTGPVAASGDSLNESLVCYPNGPNCALGAADATNGMIGARVLHAAVVAQGNKSHAEATVANAALDVPGLGNVSAEFIRADADAKCNQGSATVTGSTELAKVNGEQILVVNGFSYTIPEGQIGFEVPLGLGAFGIHVIVNEQSSGPENGGRAIDVTAIHVYTPLGDIAIGHVHADIACGQLLGCPGKNAFVTSGGFIYDPLGAKLHFAAAGRNGDTWGHVLWGPDGLHVKNPTGFVYDDATVADLAKEVASGFTAFHDLEGTLETNGTFQGAALLTWTSSQSGTSAPGEALLIDMGEPGNQPKGYDFFELVRGSGSDVAHVAGGLLQGGNVQMHGKC